jgi:hypothetical protein
VNSIAPLSVPTQTEQLVLPRYERPREEVRDAPPIDVSTCIPFVECERAIEASVLTAGSRALARGLLRLGSTRNFGGGGVGIEYGSLLKTAVRPDLLGTHVREAAAHLRGLQVDVLLVPGMSGYPVGAMYALAADLPAVLLKKVKFWAEAPASYPPGAFVIPSYTGDGDVVMHADQDALQDIVDVVARRQLEAQAGSASPAIVLRVAGADDIIDKATMSHAVSESALVVGRAAVEDFLRRHRSDTGDDRRIDVDVRVVTWVTPLIKGYNRPVEYMRRTIGVTPFAGLTVTSVHLDPAAIGIEGLGIVVFPGR